MQFFSKIQQAIYLTCFAASLQLSAAASAPIELTSPDGAIKFSITLGDKIYCSISDQQEVLLSGNGIQLHLRDAILGKNPKLTGQKRVTVDTALKPVVPFKYATLKNRYNGLLLNFRGGYSVEFRAFDDGLAYRFITTRKDTVEVLGEDFDWTFPGDYFLHTQFPGSLPYAYEVLYAHVASQQWRDEDDHSVLPVLIDTRKGTKILFSEADLIDYPNMFLKGKGAGNGIKAAFPLEPIETVYDQDGRHIRVEKTADYLTKTPGKRTFPWRMFVIAKNDTQLVENTLVARLVSHEVDFDVSWIRPGQVLWDWMSRGSDYGPEVNYHTGVNNAAYKHYIDYASRHNIPYMLIDEGWSKNRAHPMESIDEVDLPELVRYGREKNVRLILWMTFSGVHEDFKDDSFNLFEHFAQMGIAGFKIDFFDRSHVDIVRCYEKIAREAARSRLLVEFHGSYKPTGMEYRYPNILSYEAIHGMEFGGDCFPDNTLYVPFMGNTLGPLSFTPGAMLNVQPEQYQRLRPNLVVKGTRVHHMAYFIVLESGLQMIADSPRQFDQNPDCRDFIFSTPVTWDETRALFAEAGQYVVIARRKGDKWWIGAVANNAEKLRTFDLSLDFLPEGKTFNLTAFEDGLNAERQAMDYSIRRLTVTRGDQIHIKLARNGGFAAMLE
jgi:alpha-glucosidase